MDYYEKKALEAVGRIFGMKARLKRKAVYDPDCVTCYKCHSTFDKGISGLAFGDYCPKCGHSVKKALLGYDEVKE